MSVSYSIIPVNPEAHLFEVTCTIATPEPNGQIVSLPAWIPGSYMIRDFAKNIVSLTATSQGKSIASHKIDKDSWQIAPVQHELSISYRVYAYDLSVRSAHLDNTHGFFNGTSVFLRVHGCEEQACTVDIQPPPNYPHWRLATSMSSRAAPLKQPQDQCQFGEHHADNYYDLIDHPVEMGEFDWFGFEACGVPHYVALTGRHQADQQRLAADLKTICEHHIRFFAEPAPVDRYIFLVMIVGDGYGGLEHTHSTALLCSRTHMPRQHEKNISDDYREFLGLCSHEYFHTWNVKRIRPAEFISFDLQKENYTRQLWAFEGITSYYDDLALLRSGLISLDSYLQLLGKTLTRLQQTPGRHNQSVTESSFEAWTKFYKQDENAPNAIVSYYTKGAIVALLLDLKLRHFGAFTLDDVMRELWQDYCQQGQTYTGIEDSHIQNIILKLIDEKIPAPAKQNCLDDIITFMNLLLDSCNELPVTELLATIGVKLTYATAHQKNATADNTQAGQAASLGVKYKYDRVNAGNFPTITHVYNNSAAEKAGLAPGDMIIAVDGIKAQTTAFEQQIADLNINTAVTIHAFRRDEFMSFEVIPTTAEKEIIRLTADDNDAVKQTARQQWQQ